MQSTFLLSWALPWLTSAVHARSRLHLPRASEPRPLRLVGGPNLSDDLARKLWDGVDLTDEEQSQLQPQGRAAANSTALNYKGEMRILAPFDSGSNLLVAALRQNNFPLADGGLQRPEIDHHVIWKHGQSSAQDLCQQLRTSSISESLTVLIMVRSPIAQLVSWHRMPYDLKPCMNRSYEEMGQPCFANIGTDWNYHAMVQVPGFWQTWEQKIWERTPGRTLDFDNSMGIYNNYLRQYKQMLTEPSCSEINVMLVHYEDLVFTPEEVLQRVARKLGGPVPKDFVVVDSSAKGLAGVGRSEAMNKINTRAYVSELTLSALAARCKELEVSLVEDLFEKYYTEAPISYLKDCENMRR